MKVSIIIPVYNAEQYLDLCMESAVNQTLDNIEVIAIDNKSTDLSLKILKKYKEKYNFVKVIENEKNIGLSSSKNRGIYNSSGEYIFFLNSDRCIDLETIETCYNKAKENDIDIITFDGDFERIEIIKDEFISGESFFSKYSLGDGYKPQSELSLYKRNFIINNNLLFCEDLVESDELHSFKAFLLAKGVVYIPRKLIISKFTDDSKEKFIDYKEKIDNIQISLKEIYKFYLENEYRFNIKTVQSIKNYFKFICDKAAKFCEENSLLEEKSRLIETFKIEEMTYTDELIIKKVGDYRSDYKKNILFVMYLLLDGGSEKALISILDNLDYSKYNVDLVVLAKEKSYLYDINENVNVMYIYDHSSEIYEDYLSGKFNLVFEKMYDIEIGFLGIFTTWIIARFGNPNAQKITWLHGDFSLMVLGNSVEYVNNLYGMMNSVIAVSKGVKKSFIEFSGNKLQDKLQIIYNPMDIQKIRKLSVEPINYRKDKVTILSMGRLSTEKAFDRLIKVHKMLLDSGLQHNLIILGSGGEEYNLKNMIRDLNLEDSCEIVAYQKNPYSWIKMCDVFVSASITEALPLAIMEAMVLGKPIVATDTHGARALFKDNLGLMIGNSEEGLYYGIRDMILNKELRELYTKNLNEVNKFDFDKDIVMVQLENLFDGGKI